MIEEMKAAFASAQTDDEKRAVFEKYEETFLTLSQEELADVVGGAVFFDQSFQEAYESFSKKKYPAQCQDYLPETKPASFRSSFCKRRKV